MASPNTDKDNNSDNSLPSTGGTIKIFGFDIVWNIPVKFLTNIGNYKSGLISPVFESKLDNISAKWHLLLIEKTSLQLTECLIAKMMCMDQNKLKASVNFLITNPRGTFSFSCKIDREWNSNVWQTTFILQKEMLISQNSAAELNASCNILCTVTSCPARNLLSRAKWMRPFLTLVNNKQYSDVVFLIEGKQLYAYKGILASRSSVFAAMFSHNITESNNNYIEINDISYQTMYDVIQYIYTDMVPNCKLDEAEEKFKNLLIAANKYNLNYLQFILENKLISYIQVCNVFEYISFADLHNLLTLKKQAIDFVISHNDEIADSDSYKDFNRLHPDLSCEVFRSVLSKKRRLI